MNPEIIESFLQIVKYRQISLAADALYLSQATITNRLTKLERYLGVKLVNRGKGHASVTLTDYGKKLVPIAEQYLQVVQTATNIRELGKYEQLTILTTSDISGFFLAPLIQQFYKSVSNLQVTVECLPKSVILDRLKTNHDDWGLLTEPTLDDGLTSSEAFIDSLQLVTSPTIELPKIVNTDSLKRDEEVFCSYNDAYKKWHSICWDDHHLPFFQTTQITGVLPTLLYGNHWALVPKLYANQLDPKYRQHDLLESAVPFQVYSVSLPNAPKAKIIERISSIIKFNLQKRVQ